MLVTVAEKRREDACALQSFAKQSPSFMNFAQSAFGSAMRLRIAFVMRTRRSARRIESFQFRKRGRMRYFRDDELAGQT